MPPPSLPTNWPQDVTYLTAPTYSPSIPPSLQQTLHTPSRATSTWPKLPSPPTPSPNVLIAPVPPTAPHPAAGQHRLLATAPLPPSSFILPYLGLIHPSTSSDPTSDYDLALDRALDLAIDAKHAGNEARFANDYRGIRAGPNAEFGDCWVRMDEGRRWERRVGLFVLSAGRAGRRRAGIARGEEIVVNYGRVFWRERRREAEEEEEGRGEKGVGRTGLGGGLEG